MDCTYKTNAYGMPLCIINGVTALNTTFYVAFCFLSAEKTADYDWLLAALKELYVKLDLPNPNVLITDAEKGLLKAIPTNFPSPATEHLLCLWHINKNVTAHCKKYC